MIRVKFTQNHKTYKAGETAEFSKNEAFGLIDSGKAVISKDMTRQDYKITKSDEEQADGKSFKLRINQPK